MFEFDFDKHRVISMKKSFTFGMDAGASFGYNFADEMGVSMGLFYSKQGQRYKDYTWILGSDFATWSRSVSLNYLKIPMQFNYILHPKQKISFTASAGFYLSFLLGYVDKNSLIASDGSDITATAKGKTYTMSDGSSSETADFKNGKPYKSADFGFLLGAGVQFNLTDKISIPLGLYYQVGFIDVKNKTCQYTDSSGDSYLFWQDTDDTNPNGTLAYHNSSLELKIGVKINL